MKLLLLSTCAALLLTGCAGTSKYSSAAEPWRGEGGFAQIQSRPRQWDTPMQSRGIGRAVEDEEEASAPRTKNWHGE